MGTLRAGRQGLSQTGTLEPLPQDVPGERLAGSSAGALTPGTVSTASAASLLFPSPIKLLGEGQHSWCHLT